MDYNAEKLIPLLRAQTNKYTSFESSSVSYETAQTLMNGIIYTLDENFKDSVLLSEPGKEYDYSVLFEKGQEIIQNKIIRAGKIYHLIINDFEDFGVSNYHDTIINGIPYFFLHYDHLFNPSSHLLTLDYPTLLSSDSIGINLILEYLENINLERKLLLLYPKEAIVNLLKATTKDYEELYMDNICYPILFMTVFCMIAGRPINELSLEPKDYREIEDYFAGDNKKGIEKECVKFITLLCTKAKLDESYFLPFAHDFSIKWKIYLEMLTI
ncbi:MAG: DUF6179 domain-containing protein [Suipraeoptans sp.]